MNKYLAILADSLDKKAEVLRKIQDYNEKQEKAFTGGEPDLDSFDEALEEKEKLIQEVIKLDQGFETLFEKVKGELNGNREKYKAEIAVLKEKVTLVTELANAVTVREARNKKLVENYFARQKTRIRQSRQQARAAYQYQQNMSNKN